MSVDQLESALLTVGALLEDQGLSYVLVAIGGGALLLQDIVDRPTEDIDIIARVEHDGWVYAKPFPSPLQEVIRQVGLALELPVAEYSDKDWLNAGPAILLQFGLPEGFEERLTTRRFGGLTLRLASRYDLIHLKLWSATSATRRARLEIDLADLRALQPTQDEWADAVRWCARLDGRPGFLEHHARPVFQKLGVSLEIDDG